MTYQNMHHQWAIKMNCAPVMDAEHPILACIQQKSRKFQGTILANLKNVRSYLDRHILRRRVTMKRYSSSFSHRIALWSALVFGAALLLLNIWFITANERNSSLLFQLY